MCKSKSTKSASKPNTKSLENVVPRTHRGSIKYESEADDDEEVDHTASTRHEAAPATSASCSSKDDRTTDGRIKHEHIKDESDMDDEDDHKSRPRKQTHVKIAPRKSASSSKQTNDDSEVEDDEKSLVSQEDLVSDKKQRVPREIEYNSHHQKFGIYFAKRGNMRTVDGIDAKPIDVYDWPGVNSCGQNVLVQVWRNNAGPMCKFVE